MRVLPIRSFAMLIVLGVAVPASSSTLEAQITKRLKQTISGAAESEVMNQIDRMVRGKIRCVFDDLECITAAEKSGKGVVLTDDDGEILVDKDGKPVSDPEQGAVLAAGAGDAAPGDGVWANYDFVPGDKVLYHEDYASDNVGDFPRRMELVRGNWEVVEVNGRRFMRSTGPLRAAVRILLPEDLPQRFTIEMEVRTTSESQQVIVATATPPKGRDWRSLTGNVLSASPFWGTGLDNVNRGEVWSINETKRFGKALTPLRLTADGSYVKVYVEEQRVANVPNAEMPRGSELYVEVYSGATDKAPIYFGEIRVAAGGRDLYNRLAADGRVATRGILFGVNSARIRPESTPTLAEIGKMLKDHPDLRIRIEGHTDSSGEDAFNQKLSEERAAAVLEYLITKFGVGAARVEAVGLGETKPVDSNDTAEGRQNNRRVELVRLDP